MAFVSLLSPSLGSQNLGDHIIRDAVIAQLHSLEILPTLELSLPYRPHLKSLCLSRHHRHIILAGTNAFGSDFRAKAGLSPELVRLYRHKVILMGVGWGCYDLKPSLLANWTWRTLLSPDSLHSVRDEYTADILHRMGYRVAMTGCPTTWDLQPPANLPRSLPTEARCALVTVTNYRQDPPRDKRWIDLLANCFTKVLYQPIAPGDHCYLGDLGVSAQSIQPQSLAGFHATLASKGSVVYVGTRLHAGIRALQARRPSIILAVDNRAAEMARIGNLPIINVSDISTLDSLLGQLFEGKELPYGYAATPEQQAEIDSFRVDLAAVICSTAARHAPDPPEG